MAWFQPKKKKPMIGIEKDRPERVVGPVGPYPSNPSKEGFQPKGRGREDFQPTTELGQVLGSDDPKVQLEHARQLLVAVNLQDLVITVHLNARTGQVSTSTCGVSLTTQQARQVLSAGIEALVRVEAEQAAKVQPQQPAKEG